MGQVIRFAGYAALFDVVDRGGDVFRAGAFGRPRTVPLLWQHRGMPVGTAEVAEDARGLRVIGSVGGEAAGLVASGALAGLSVGYRPVRVHGGGRARELRAVALVEVSLVAQPMQPGARVLAVRPAPACVPRDGSARGPDGGA